MKSFIPLFLALGLPVATVPPCYAENPPAVTGQAAQEALIAQAKETVRSGLRDPESAVFKDVRYGTCVKGAWVYGWVNSRNGYGGMTGFQRFVASGSKVLLEEEDDVEFFNTWRALRIAQEKTPAL